MKKTMTLVLLATLALGVLLGFIIDRYLLERSSPAPVIEEVAEQVQEDVPTSLNFTDSDTSASASTFCQDLKDRIPGSSGFFITTTVASGELVVDSSIISGCVYSVNDSYGGWAPFEGQVGSYALVASDGTILDEGPLSVVDEDWIEAALAGEAIAYEQRVSLPSGGFGTGSLIINNENASGEPAFDKEIVIPVAF